MAASVLANAEKKLRAYALGFPEVFEDFPWGERVFKVRKKIFAFVNRDAERGLSVTVKLGGSADEALQLPFAQPTGYGLGKSGWVTATFRRSEQPPVGILCDWIGESYRLIAPKKLAALLD